MAPDQILAFVLALTSPAPAEPLFPVIAAGGADSRYPVVAAPCPRPLAPYEVEGHTVVCGKVNVPEVSWPQKSEQPDKWSLCCPGA